MTKIMVFFAFFVAISIWGTGYLDENQNVNEELFFVTLGKDNAKRLGFNKIILHNLYHTNNVTSVNQSINVTNGQCKRVIGTPDALKTLIIEVYASPRDGNGDINARIGIGGDVLKLKQVDAFELIAHKVDKVHSAIMSCYKSKAINQSLLESLQ